MEKIQVIKVCVCARLRVCVPFSGRCLWLTLLFTAVPGIKRAPLRVTHLTTSCVPKGEKNHSGARC